MSELFIIKKIEELENEALKEKNETLKAELYAEANYWRAELQEFQCNPFNYEEGESPMIYIS